MSFHYDHQSLGVFLNEDLRIIQIAYSGVVSERWETQEPDGADVARYVLRLYDRGIVDPQKLTQLTSMHFRNQLHILRHA